MISVCVTTLCVIQVFYCKLVRSENHTFEPPNLKTVLFKDKDMLDRCWCSHEVNLLLNRRVLQDLVPRTIPRDLPLLLKYLKGVEETAMKTTPSMNRTLLLMALGDVIGGYLQAIVIPIAKEAYYAGNVDYSTVAKLHEMLEKWKWYLSTDGGTWCQECDMRKITTKVSVLEVNMHDEESACDQLYVSHPKPNGTDHLGSESVNSSNISRIPIPSLDNNVIPSAIALPIKKHAVVSLSDPKSAFILVRYYTLSMRCLSGNPKSVLTFNNHFHVWIVNKVIPHLNDQDRWYPAFGAVMRIFETIKQKNISLASYDDVHQIEDEPEDAALDANLGLGLTSIKHSENIANYFHIINNPYALIILFGLILFLVAIMCCLCICCCLQLRKKKKKSVLFLSDSDDCVLKNVIISLYCSLKNTLTRSSESLTKYENQESEEVNLERNFGRTDLLPYSDSNPYSNLGDYSDVPYSDIESSNSEVESSGSSREDTQNNLK